MKVIEGPVVVCPEKFRKEIIFIHHRRDGKKDVATV
jgi:hypothetical protein